MITETHVPIYGYGGIIAYALVDAADAPFALAYRWNLNNHGAPQRKVRVGGKRTSLLLHRQLMGLKPGDGMQVDHINRNPLDNRRANLRIVTNAENGQNRSPTGHSNSSSGVRGVHWHKGKQKWCPVVIIRGERHNLGSFDTKEAAANAAAAFRRQHMPFSASDLMDDRAAA